MTPARYPLLGRLCFTLLLPVAMLSFGANAGCLPSSDPAIQRLEEQLGLEPAAVARAVTQQLDSGTIVDAAKRGELYSMLASAHGALDQYQDALAAVSEGMKLVPDERSPVHVNLAVTRATNTYDDGVSEEIKNLNALRAKQVQGSPAEVCLLIALGSMEHQAGRPDQASIYLTRAYSLSADPSRLRQRVFAADTLSIVLRDLGDYAQALSLNHEVLEWDRDRNALFDLAITRFLRGSILRDSGNHRAAIAELEASRQLSAKTGDPLGDGFTNYLMCLSRIELGSLQLARAQCTAAEDVFANAESIGQQKLAAAALARIDLLQGDAKAAVSRLNRVLDQEGRDIPQRRVAQIYETRAQAHAALGQYEAAFSDLGTYLQRYKASAAADRAGEAAALRTRLETDRELERNAALSRELELRSEHIRLQNERLRWTIVAAVAASCMTVLLAVLLLMHRRQKRKLAQLAHFDDLTGLPNRRHTMDLAAAAFDQAARDHTSLTIGVLDLDHFKRINDVYGHAVGDTVLKEFARIGLAHIRQGDVLGRWGGEEFLIVLPNTTLDIALGVVERLRRAALSIRVDDAGMDLNVSMSAGLATNEGGVESLDAIVALADAALYDAKKSGRDLVCVAPESYSVAPQQIRMELKRSGVALTTGKFSRRSPST